MRKKQRKTFPNWIKLSDQDDKQPHAKDKKKTNPVVVTVSRHSVPHVSMTTITEESVCGK